MRSYVAVALLALVLVAPPAAALGPASQLTLDAAGEVRNLQSGETHVIPFVARITLSEFACFQEASFPIYLGLESAGPLAVTLSAETAYFTVPAGDYVTTPYHGEAHFEATLVAQEPGHAQTQIRATFDHDGRPCTAPGGFSASIATYTITLEVVPAEAPAGNTSAGGAGDAEPGTGDPTLDNGTAETNETPDDGYEWAGSELPGGDRATGGGGTPIGEFEGDPQESRAATPAAPIAVALVLLGAAALTMRRHKR